MTPEEQGFLEEYLAPSRMAVVATIGRDGMPQLTPNWYVYADGAVHVSTTKERIKHRNVSRDPRISICIYSEPFASEYVVFTGRAAIADDDSIWPLTRRIVERYVEPFGVDGRMAQLRTENRVLISLKPDKVLRRTVTGIPGRRE